MRFVSWLVQRFNQKGSFFRKRYVIESSMIFRFSQMRFACFGLSETKALEGDSREIHLHGAVATIYFALLLLSVSYLVNKSLHFGLFTLM